METKIEEHYILLDGKVKCVHCKRQWLTFSVTSKRAHLSSREWSIFYKVANCEGSEMRVDPELVAKNDAYFADLRKKNNELQDRNAKKERHISQSLSSSASNCSSTPQSLSEEESSSRKKQATLYDFVNPARSHDADVAIADFFYRCSIPFDCAETLAYQKLVEAIKAAPSSYVPPKEKRIRTTLLDQKYEEVLTCRTAAFDEVLRKGYALALTTDGATISKRPVSNVLVAVPFHGPELITYDDASEHLQDGGKKDARYYAELLRDAIEELGPRNVVIICTDNAAVMQACWTELAPLYPWIFFTGCLAHKGNTFVKKVCNIFFVSELIAKAKRITHHFGEMHANCALMKKYTMIHLQKELGFVIPSETRFGLFLIMLHRIALLKPAIQATACDVHFVEGDDMSELVLQGTFFDEVLQLIQYMMPVLRFIRLADCEDEMISLIFSRVTAIDEHFVQNLNSIPSMPGVAQDVLALFRQESSGWVTDLHKTMHVLNPKYSEDFKDPTIKLAIKNTLKQIYHDDPVKQVQAMSDILYYVDREGEYGELVTKAAMETMIPSNFFRINGSSTPLLQDICIRYHPQIVASSCAERNFKQFKDIRTKKRNRMLTDTVEKLVIVQSSLVREEKNLKEDPIEQMKGWVAEDLFTNESASLNRSHQIRAKSFTNFIEPWEHESISEQLLGHEEKLLRKYKNICFKDDDPDYVLHTGRVVGIEWKKRKGSTPAGYVLVTIDINDDTREPECYVINETFHDLIKACDIEYNSAFKFVLE